MKKLYTLSILLLTSLSFGQIPISLTGVGDPYNQDFNGMGATTTFPSGWTAINNSGSTLTMGVTDGSGTLTGNIYNVGTTGNTDRAFGTLADATTTPTLGAVFQNNTGSTATSILILSRMEQWKESGNASLNEIVAFSYSLNAASLSDPSAIWVPVTALNLNEKLTTATGGAALDGNLSGNYRNLTSLISGLNWTNGTNLWIKWTDNNDALANGMYAIDDFNIRTYVPLGVKQNAIAGLNMYPNPVVNGTLFITSKSSEAKSVLVYDLLGKQVLNTKTSNNAVNVSNLKGGSYIIKITENGKTDSKKLIIQ
ncbi:T9SS type A sorting domain-containing protein [Flavobacterium limnophilum]|uniref:T9SS type A sorting domain-containing protein n=1 Tax=Flavobacterium limnophilum TaxID=3003262 RepID=UPI0022ABDAE1|nr:T9SS type A sorting domain-containing protein [Flavobacterium limnophilum]